MYLERCKHELVLFAEVMEYFPYHLELLACYYSVIDNLEEIFEL